MNNNDDFYHYKREISDIFTKVASNYDTIGTPFFSYFGEKMVDKVNISPNHTVLDIACGKGASLIPASKRMGASGCIIGIDLSEGMINHLSSIIKNKKLKNAELKIADAEKLDFPEGFFDVVLCGFSLPMFPRYQLVLNEIGRVLKDGGTIALSTWNDEYELKWRNELYTKYIQLSRENKQKKTPKHGILRKLKYVFSRGKRTQTQIKPQFGTSQGMKNLLTEAGFQYINVYEEKIDCRYKNDEEWYERMLAQGSRRVLDKISFENIEKLKKEAFDNLKNYKKGEEIEITMSALVTIAQKGSA